MSLPWKPTPWLGLALITALGCAPTPAAEPVPAPDAALLGYVLDAAPRKIQHPLYIDYEGKARLIGYDVEPEGEVAPGSRFKLRMYWLSTSKLGPGWRLFTHLVDDRGRQLSNLDAVGPLRQPAGEGAQALGPSRWIPGKVYVDEQDIDVPAGAATPRVTVSVGIWRNFCGAVETSEAGRRCVSWRDSRLQILSGPSDGKQAGIVHHVTTGWTPPLASAAPPPAAPPSATP